MRKKFFIFIAILSISSSIYSKSVFETEVKGFAGYNNVRYSSVVGEEKHDDIVMGYGAQFNWCFNRFFGITLGLDTTMPLYSHSQKDNVVETGGFHPNIFSIGFDGFLPFAGLIIMFPINNHMRIKTTYNFGVTSYDRFDPIYLEDGTKVSFVYTYYGLKGEVAAYWIPVKLLGIEFGLQYNLCFLDEKKTLPVSGYPYTVNGVNWCVKPYVGVNLRLGRGM